MSATLLAPELETFPNRYRLPVEAYYRLMDLGFLEGRFEILDGEIVSKMGQNPQHARLLTRFNRLFSALFGPGVIRIQVPIIIPGPDGIYNEPEPDFVVTRETDDAYSDRHPGPDDALLVLEVSDSTLSTDLILKARLYARAGITDFWVLDIANRVLHVHRGPLNGEYGSVSVYRDTENAEVLARPGMTVSVSDLFPPVA
jgi:Uma2 family endonuclease